MGFVGILFLAVGLAMDSMAAASTRGLAVGVLRPQHALVVALYFGGFQAGMPLIGYFIGDRFGSLVAAYDHWIAFVILGAIGGKMIHEAFESSDSEKSAKSETRAPFGPSVMLPLAVATSIDALAAGITLPMLGAPLVISLATIGVTTGALSASGLYLGRRFGAVLGKRLDVFGGLILIALGMKILIEHVTNGT